ncbi:MAG: hypothetical protein OEX04_07635 [Acidimicrobiia bacterium]|nr:hypothetical protein [Acidimicrobiia bacterium]MDH4307336.1 hypothetical protein [Acidimicrobiia bacterium]MDH5294473.1 hypothetical protein [Acidimicrobiia bacterium]
MTEERVEPDDPLENLARELRQTVGAEFRAEAEAVETESEIGRLRRRSLADVARQSADRGDLISVVLRDRTVTGHIVGAGKDYVSVETPSEWIDARLSRIAITITPAHRGGLVPKGGSITFQARLAEFEHTSEAVELVAPDLGHAVCGRIRVVAGDHVIVRDIDGIDTVLPTGMVDVVVRSRPRQP